MDENTTIEELILMGAVEVAAIDYKTGEFLYNFTDKVKDLIPALYEEHMASVHSEIMYFWELGFVELSDLDGKNPIVRLTEKAFSDKEVSELPSEKQLILDEIKRILKVL